MIKTGDMLYDCYPEEGIYTVLLVVEPYQSRHVLNAWHCDLMQVYCLRDLVTARAGLVFTERYLSTLSPEPY